MRTEVEIARRHHARWAAAKEAVNSDSPFDVPNDVRDEINEANRQDWVEFVAERDGKVLKDSDQSPGHRHGAKQIAEFCAKVPGLEVDAVLLAAACQCSESTARAFITGNRYMFKAVPGKRGSYTVVDVDAERAASRGVVVPGTLADINGVVGADIAQIESGLRQIGGHDG